MQLHKKLLPSRKDVLGHFNCDWTHLPVESRAVDFGLLHFLQLKEQKRPKQLSLQLLLI